MKKIFFSLIFSLGLFLPIVVLAKSPDPIIKKIKITKVKGFGTAKISPDQDFFKLFAFTVANNSDEDVIIRNINFRQTGVKNSILKNITIDSYRTEDKYFGGVIGSSHTGTGEKDAEVPITFSIKDLNNAYSYSGDSVLIAAHGVKSFGVEISISPRAKIGTSEILRIDSISFIKITGQATGSALADIEAATFLVKTPVLSPALKVVVNKQPVISLLYEDYGISACSVSSGQSEKCRIAWKSNMGDSQMKVYFVTSNGPIRTWTVPNTGFFDISPQDIPLDTDFTIMVQGVSSNVSASSRQFFRMSKDHSSNSYP